jgi:hypothetical protein
MAGFAWLFLRAWLDPASRGESRERTTFLKRIMSFRRKRAARVAETNETVAQA